MRPGCKIQTFEAVSKDIATIATTDAKGDAAIDRADSRHRRDAPLEAKIFCAPASRADARSSAIVTLPICRRAASSA